MLHPSEANQIGHHDIRRFPDVPAALRERLRADQDRLIREAIGEFTPLERRVFADNLLSTLVHDVNVLRGLSGDPAEVLFTDVWAGGESMLTVLRYPSGVRATIALHYLPDLANYQETVAYYAKADRITARRSRRRSSGTCRPAIVVESHGGGQARREARHRLHEGGVQGGAAPLRRVRARRARGRSRRPRRREGDVALLHKIFHAIKRPLVG